LAPPRPQLLTTVGAVAVRRGAGESAFFYTAGMTIDADGAPRAYHPAIKGRPSGSPPGLDDLRNAGRPGHWFGIVTDTHGRPVVQGARDPAPGFYISATSLTNKGHTRDDDPRRYIDASAVPYIVLPPAALHAGQARLGDIAAVFNRRNERVAFAIFADIGPKLHIGEGSIALAEALAIPADPKAGGDRIIVYVVFPGSGNGFGRRVNVIERVGRRLLHQWGGSARLGATRP
jgi:glycosyl hydrolase group 75 (putative chitosanase)